MVNKGSIYRLGGADPRSGVERLAGVVNRAVQPKALKKQARTYSDSPTTMAVNRRAAARKK